MTSASKRLADSAILVENLVRTGKFPDPVQDIRVIETHISWVLLTGAYAYKIKKPVDLGFLDFSSLDKRRHFCAEELRLNRRFAARIYLDVVNIGGTVDEPVMNAKEGPVLEVAVRMRQFPDDALLSRQLVEGKVSIADMANLGITLARLHADAPAADGGSEYGVPAAVFAPVEGNFQVLEAALKNQSRLRQLGVIRDWTRTEASRVEPMIRDRKRAGSVRECHGDLHLANLVYWKDRIVPFDCLEFDPRLRWIDVISEVAFLFMDTLQAGRLDLAYAFLNSYLAESGDYTGLSLLPFYVVYRALVRAKVQALTDQADSYDGPAGEYLELAGHWAAPVQKQKLIITHGLSGSGKTVLTEKLMTALPAIRLRSDLERKRLHGLAEPARTGSGIGEGLYDPAAGKRTYARLAELAGTGLRAGFNMIVDAAFLDPLQRSAFLELAAETGSDIVLLACNAPPSVLRERVARRECAGSDASEAGLAVLSSQLENYRPLTDEEEARTIHIDTELDWSGEDLTRQCR